MVKMTYKTKLLISLLIIVGPGFAAIDALAQASNIVVTTSRNPVALDDSFHLLYEADSSVDDDPDFTPIYKDFDVLSSSQSTNMRSINGDWSMKKSWDLTVIAKDVGKFTIPAIAFGSDISPAIQITVTNSSSPNSILPDGQASVPAQIFLESMLDKKSGWVQSQFVYTVRLLRTVSITGASLSEPETSNADAIIQKIGDDSQYQTTRNGVRYEVIERRYAIFPQKSGQLKINPVTFEGRVNSSQPRTIFDQFRMSGQLKRLRSKAVTATVKPAPATINLQDWLPARQLQLTEEWSDDIQHIKTGEPITRTITIAAEGLTSEQLPDLRFKEVGGIKQYPDKPVTENRVSTSDTSSGITGLKQIKIALIPSQPGSYTLPEISLQWWNTKTNKAETARIKETIITAIGNAAASTVIDTPVKTANTDPASQTSQATPDKADDRPLTTAPQPIERPYWKWLSLLLGIAWLITLLLLFKKKDSGHMPIKQKTETSSVALKSAVSTVEKQAKNNDAEHTKEGLIEWAKIFYADNTISNLSLISARCSTALSIELERLNQSLYNPKRPSWDNKALLAAFKSEQSSKRKDHQTSALKPLY
ncbi:MAG: BatD family protein [Gammaproteobacteria bacterium]|nr:BatD family protein [Gammaproteobacteria bacterium]